MTMPANTSPSSASLLNLGLANRETRYTPLDCELPLPDASTDIGIIEWEIIKDRLLEVMASPMLVETPGKPPVIIDSAMSPGTQGLRTAMFDQIPEGCRTMNCWEFERLARAGIWKGSNADRIVSGSPDCYRVSIMSLNTAKPTWEKSLTTATSVNKSQLAFGGPTYPGTAWAYDFKRG